MAKETDARQFHIGTIMSISTDYLLAPNRIGGVYEILDYMAGDSLYTHQLGRAAKEVKPEILKQLPFLGSDEMLNEVRRLEETLPLLTTDEPRTQFVEAFVQQMAAKFGEFHELMPVPFSVEHKDPIEELQEMVPPDKIVIIGGE